MGQRLRPNVLAPRFVGEIRSIDASTQLSDSTIDSIKSCWTEYPVLIFPDQKLDHDELASFSNRLGEFGVDSFVLPSAENSHIIEVRRDPEESAPIFGANWHSDWSFQGAPPSGTLLHAKIIPPRGGDTLFADCYRAYEALPKALQSKLANLTAQHCAGPAYGPSGLFAKDDTTRSMAIVVSPEADESQSHPMVRTHPESGRRSLFINHVYTVRIDNMAQAASRKLLNELFAHMTQSEFIYRHKWQSGTLVLWDNRCVMHYAAGGYSGYQRVMHRTVLAGDRPC